MPSLGVAGASCCCLAGLWLYEKNRRAASRAQQRYEALSTSAEHEDDEDVDEELADEFLEAEEEEEVEIPQTPVGDLLGAFETASPRCSAAPLSANSASWVAEMNAELAEFDATTDLGQSPDGGAWEQRMESELQQQLAEAVTPPPGSRGKR